MALASSHVAHSIMSSASNLPSGNQTWLAGKFPIELYIDGFRVKTFQTSIFDRYFPLPCLIPEGHQCLCMWHARRPSLLHKQSFSLLHDFLPSPLFGLVHGSHHLQQWHPIFALVIFWQLSIVDHPP